MAQALDQQLTGALSTPQTIEQRKLETLLQINRAIGTVLDVNAVVEQVMRQVTRVFEADRSSLLLHDPETKELYSRVAQGLEHWPESLRIPDDAGICGHVFQTHEPALVKDTFEDRHFAREVAEKTGYVPRSMLIAPVAHRQGQCAGVLQVLDRRVGYFKESDLELLEAIAVSVGIAIDNARLYEAQRKQFDSFVSALSAAIDARDPCTQLHSINVANYARGIATMLRLDAASQEYLRVAGLLHDVGKIGTPEAILTKPGKLTDAEFSEMRRHTQHSRRILSQIDFIKRYRDMAFVASAHHEKLDGTGYPDGLEGERIPMLSRILVVADIYDALTQPRHYRDGMSMDRAVEILDSMTPRQLDARCVDALKAFLGLRPKPE